MANAAKTETDTAKPAKVAALVLPAEAASSTEPQVLGGFPGRWVPGEPVALAALDIDEQTARELIARLGLPLKVVMVYAAGEFRRETHGQIGALDAAAARDADAAVKEQPSLVTSKVTIAGGIAPAEPEPEPEAEVV